MPDLLAAALTGIERTEHSIASTSQLFDTAQCTWADDLIAALGIPRSIFPDSAEPGTVLGPMLPAVASRLGVAPVTVISPAGHDTGSAVAAVPADGPGDWAYISSGTWSLVGRELEAPLRTPEALAANFTNECGLSRTIRFHKNIGGLWLLQECLRAWTEEGRAISYSQQAELVEQTPRLRSLIDPDHPSLAEFGGMPGRIAALCAAAGEEVPASQGAMIRCILESLALKYRMVLQTLEKLTGPVRRIFIVGGGVQNHLLCRYTADATGLPVVAGPVEATAAGNILAQAMAQGRLASLAEIRKVVAGSFDLSRYTPAAGACWDSAYSRFERIVALTPR